METHTDQTDIAGQTLLKLIPAIYLGTHLDSDKERQVAINMFKVGIEIIEKTIENK